MLVEHWVKSPRVDTILELFPPGGVMDEIAQFGKIQAITDKIIERVINITGKCFIYILGNINNKKLFIR